MLDHLVVYAPRLIEPYMEPVLKVLVPKLRELDLNPGVVVSILTCIGDLAEVCTTKSVLYSSICFILPLLFLHYLHHLPSLILCLIF